jgi:hypothetical protein
MNNYGVLKESLNRLYILRETKSLNSSKTREEDWLESLIRILLGYRGEDDIEIPVDLGLLQGEHDLFQALKERIEGLI